MSTRRYNEKMRTARQVAEFDRLRAFCGVDPLKQQSLQATPMQVVAQS
jgi:hypothetical protein